MNKIENVITYLTKTKGLTIKGIIERLEYEGEPMQRILFTSWRRSTIPGRSDTLADLIVMAFPEHFDEGMPLDADAAERPKKSDYQQRFDDLMKKRVEELTAEVEQQKRRINELLDTIVKMATYTSKKE